MKRACAAEEKWVTMGDPGEGDKKADDDEVVKEFLRLLEEKCECSSESESDDVGAYESEDSSEDEWDDSSEEDEDGAASEGDEDTEEEAAARAERERKAKERERERAESSRCTWRAMLAVNAQTLARTRWTNPAPEKGASLQDMPDLVLLRVMHFLPLRDIGSLARVCFPTPPLFHLFLHAFCAHVLFLCIRMLSNRRAGS